MCSGAYPSDGAWRWRLILWRDRGYSKLFMLHEAEIEGGNSGVEEVGRTEGHQGVE